MHCGCRFSLRLEIIKQNRVGRTKTYVNLSSSYGLYLYHLLLSCHLDFKYFGMQRFTNRICKNVLKTRDSNKTMELNRFDDSNLKKDQRFCVQEINFGVCKFWLG